MTTDNSEFLSRLRRTRHKPAVGEVFAVHARELGWIFGRVASVDAVLYPEPDPICDGIVVYFFWPAAPKPEPPASLPATNFLCPPMIVARTLWTKGFAQPILNRQFDTGERVTPHCFEMIGTSRAARYFDEHGHPLPGRVEPCSPLALTLDPGVSWHLAAACRARVKSEGSAIGRAEE